MISRDQADANLNRAVKNNDDVGVQAALDAGADPNLYDFCSDSMIKIAADKGFDRVVKVLLDGGANANGVGMNGYIINPLYFAIAGGHTEVVRVMLSSEFYNVDVNAYVYDMVTPLKYASQKGHLEIAELLLAHGAKHDIGYSYDGGISALSFAAESGHLDIARVLIKAGADVNSREVFRNTPLHAAAAKGQLEMARLLVDSGANIDAVNRFGDTPANVAAKNGYQEIVKLIRAKHEQNVVAKQQAPVSSNSLFTARKQSAVDAPSAKLLEMMKSRPEDVLAALNAIDTQLAEKLVSEMEARVRLD